MCNDRGHPQGAPAAQPSLAPRLWMRCLLVAVVGAVLVLSAGLWTIRKTNDLKIREATRFQFAAIALSLVNFSETHGHLPYSTRWSSAGQSTDEISATAVRRPLYSWRVEIVPYLESWHGVWDPTKAWDDSANTQLSELSRYYAYGGTVPGGQTNGFPETNCLAITGRGTAFGNGSELPRALQDIPPDTIIIVETRASRIPWPAPGDFDIRTMPQSINTPDARGISSRAANGFHVIFADGQVWFLSEEVPFETLQLFFTVASSQRYDRERHLEPFAVRHGP